MNKIFRIVCEPTGSVWLWKFEDDQQERVMQFYSLQKAG